LDCRKRRLSSLLNCDALSKPTQSAAAAEPVIHKQHAHGMAEACLLAGVDETPGGCHSCNLANLLQADPRPDSERFPLLLVQSPFLGLLRLGPTLLLLPATLSFPRD
jgi:hypothetical protein